MVKSMTLRKVKEVQALGCEFNHSVTLESAAWADLGDEPVEVACENRKRKRETVEQDTGCAESLVNSGPTSQSATETLGRLCCFPCMSEYNCGRRAPLSRLLPVAENGKIRDLCFQCAKVLDPQLSQKKFRLTAVQLRACERVAISLKEEMKHAPFESLIFNEFKRLKKRGTPSEKAILKRIGEPGFLKLCRDAIHMKNFPTDTEAKLLARSKAMDVVAIVRSAQKAWGEARLTTATSAGEFLRMMVGDERTKIRAGGGYFCEKCMKQTRYDFHWTKATGTGSLSDWFCGPCGAPYDKTRMAGVLTFADVKEPDNSFVVRTRMPSGTVANFRTAISLANLIRQGECNVSDDDVKRYGSLGMAFRAAISSDNDRYYRSFDQLREVVCACTLTRPNLQGKDLPCFKICEGDGDVTLKQADYGRGCEAYDLNRLFSGDEDQQAELDDGPWKAILRAVVSAWGIADAAAIDPEMLNKWSKCSKGTLKKLRLWTFLRATQQYPPTKADEPGMKGSEADLAWAAKPFEF